MHTHRLYTSKPSMSFPGVAQTWWSLTDTEIEGRASRVLCLFSLAAAGWKLSPMVQGIYGPELYAGLHMTSAGGNNKNNNNNNNNKREPLFSGHSNFAWNVLITPIPTLRPSQFLASHIPQQLRPPPRQQHSGELT